jgi:RHS repeat-associated protein
LNIASSIPYQSIIQSKYHIKISITITQKTHTLASGLIDDLTMSYQPGTNKLSTVTDNGQADMKHLGFNQLAGSGATAHSYDNAGNLTYDHTKKAIITYNYLNLPTTITFQNGNIIEYAYDANGKKLQTTRKTNSTTIADMHQYSDGIEYKQSGSTYLLESIYHPEGRIYNTNVTNPNTTALALRHEFSIKDHLGNSRITFSDINNNGSIQVPTEIIQENHYYPFGLNMGGAWMNDNTAIDNPYQYNGKELESFGGLGWSDYGARWYDAATARFTTVDPMADEPEQIDKSPYAYGWNNPIKYDDPDGRCPNCLTALGGALLQGGIELGSQLLAGKSLGEVDWADVGVEALQGAAKGSGIGLLASGAVEVVGTFAKASTDVTFDGGTKTVFNGSKSKTEAAVDVVIDKTAGAVGKKIASSSKAAVASTTNAVESSNKALKKAENAYNKATDSGKNAYGSKATGVTQKLADARANASGAAAQQVVTKTANKVVNSTAGKVAGKAADTSIGDKVKRWFGF